MDEGGLVPAMVTEGKRAPAFNLPSSEGGKMNLRDAEGQWLILYFYPRDNTPGCTTEACEFRDADEALADRDAMVVGVSRDSLESHEKFIDKYDLNFPLLSDKDTKVLEKYGAWGEKNLYGKKSMGIIRTTVIIDPKGKVRKVFPKVRVKGHVDKVLETLDELQAE